MVPSYLAPSCGTTRRFNFNLNPLRVANKLNATHQSINCVLKLLAAIMPRIFCCALLQIFNNMVQIVSVFKAITWTDHEYVIEMYLNT